MGNDVHVSLRSGDLVNLKAVDLEDGTHALRVEGGLVANGGVPPNVTRKLRIEGKNTNVSNTGLWVDIWEGGADTIPEPSPAGETLAIRGNNVNDTLLGTGAQMVRVEYLNTLEQLTFIDVPMNGDALIVTAITNFTDVIDFYTIANGSNNTPVGDIQIVNVAETVEYAVIKSGGNKSQSSLRHLLATSTFYLTGMLVSSNSKGLEVALRSTSNDSGDVFDGVYLYQVPLTVSDAPISIPFYPALEIPPTARMKVSARTTLNGTHNVSVWINGWVKV